MFKIHYVLLSTFCIVFSAFVHISYIYKYIDSIMYTYYYYLILTGHFTSFMQQLLEVVPPQNFDDKENSSNSSLQVSETKPNKLPQKSSKI